MQRRNRSQGDGQVPAGYVVDYDYILKEQIDINKKLYVAEIGYDSWNATQYVINAEQAGLPMAVYSQTLGSFNKPTKFFEMLIRSGKCIIDANPALDWMFANVELREDHYENVKPVKANGEKNNKIRFLSLPCLKRRIITMLIWR